MTASTDNTTRNSGIGDNMSEKCKQCGTEAEDGKEFPVVAVMNLHDGGVEDCLCDKDGMPIASFGGKFLAYPMCKKCHEAPKLKASYFMRADSEIALRLAGMSGLQMPKRQSEAG